MDADRRGFIGLSAAFAALGLPAAGRHDARLPLGAEKMRFGAISDIHISTPAQLPYFEKTLRKLDEWKADAVLVCGDLADYGMAQELQLIADTWFKVFPGGKGADGRPVVNLMHYGDHDMATWYLDRSDAAKEWPSIEERKAGLIFRGDRKAIWEKCFGEPWEPIALKVVKGYPFVLSHFTRGEEGNPYGNNVPGLEAFLKAHRFDPKKPLFYSQHRITRGTAGGAHVGRCDDGTTTKILSAYPNAVAFGGDTHLCGTCEQSIWQGAYTSIQVPSLRYCCTQSGRENGYCTRDRPPRPPVQTMEQFPSHTNGTHQGFFCIVYENALVVRRWDFANDGSIGPDWVVPFSSFAQRASERPFSPEVRERTVPPPEFAPDAKVSLSMTRAKNRLNQLRDMVAVTFPPAVPTADGLRTDDYEVTLELFDYDVTKILAQHRVYSPRYMHPVKLDTEPVTCLVDASEFPPDRRTIDVVVRPCNVFGRKGRPITARILDMKDLAAVASCKSAQPVKH